MIAFNKKVKYILVGSLNTLFGYLIGIFAYLTIGAYLHIAAVALISGILSITFSFITYKFLVFDSKSKWLPQYLKSYVVYGYSMVMSAGVLWALISGLDINIWVAQAVAVGMTAVTSYIMHDKFTFASHETH